MDNYRHHISGFFTGPAQAEQVVELMLEYGIARKRIHIFDKSSILPEALSANASENKSDAVLKDVLVDAAVGSAAGTGLSVLVGVGLVAMNVTLFVASPLIAPLTLLGWGASLGGIVGASVGAAEKPKPLADLVRDATLAGQSVVVVESLSAEETEAISKIFEGSVAIIDDDSKVASPLINS